MQVEQLKDTATAALLATASTDDPSAAVATLKDLGLSWQTYKNACSSASLGTYINLSIFTQTFIFSSAHPPVSLAGS